jgi:fatty-acid desaturase
VYQNAKITLEDFRQKIKLDQIWPPPITHIINCIHHMPTDDYSAPHSDLNFSNKMHEHVDYTQSFAVYKLLAVVSKTNKRSDIRKPITMSLVKQIIEALPTICSSYIEAILFASIFPLAFCGFVENRRSSLIWNIISYFRS